MLYEEVLILGRNHARCDGFSFIGHESCGLSSVPDAFMILPCSLHCWATNSWNGLPFCQCPCLGGHRWRAWMTKRRVEALSHVHRAIRLMRHDQIEFCHLWVRSSCLPSCPLWSTTTYVGLVGRGLGLLYFEERRPVSMGQVRLKTLMAQKLRFQGRQRHIGFSSARARSFVPARIN